MTEPKRKLKGLANLGSALDERINSQTKQLDIRHDTGAPTPAPVASGIAPGGGGGGPEPALPESFVTSLKESSAGSALTGELELAGSGDTQIAQSSSAPHFTVDSPAYTASDGVRRTADEFSCDSTVVRTSGDQSVGGVKSFTEFPITPSSTPAADYECANKKYVDDGTHWQRDSGPGELKPLLTDDYVKVSRAQGGAAISGINTTSVGDKIGLLGMAGIPGVSPSPAAVAGLSTDSFAFAGYSEANTAIIGASNSIANDKYGGEFSCTALGEHADLVESASIPATPPGSKVRMCVLSDGRLLAKDDQGSVHDLAVQHKQVFNCIGGQSAAPFIALHYDSGIFPSTAIGAATVTASAHVVFALPGSAGMATLDSSYGRWEWTGALVDSDLTQSQIVVGVPLRKWGNTVRLRARFRLNNALRLDGLYLGINDASNTDTVLNTAQAGITLAGANDALWVEADSGEVDISGWSGALRATLSAQGASDSNAGLTQFDVEWLVIEQWAR